MYYHEFQILKWKTYEIQFLVFKRALDLQFWDCPSYDKQYSDCQAPFWY